MARVNVDLSSVLRGIENLLDPAFVESAGRQIAFEGAEVIRDEARRRAPLHAGEFNPASKGGSVVGELRDNIGAFRNRELTNDKQFAYTVSWNHKTVWWAINVEMGYQQPYVVVFDNTTGMYWTMKDKAGKKVKRPDGPRHVNAQPFLGPAYDAKQKEAQEAMAAAARKVMGITR